MTPVRLGFITGRRVHTGGDGLWTDAGLGRLVDALGATFDLTLAAMASDARAPLQDHRLTVAPDRLVRLPTTTTATGLLRWPAVLRAIRQVERRAEVTVVQLPFPAPLALTRAARPRVYHVCGDVRGVVRASATGRGVRGALAVGVAGAIDRWYRRLLRAPGSAAVTNGRALFEHYRPRRGRPTVSSTISEAEIGSVTRTRPSDAPFRVLFVGYLRHEKGIDVLLDAFDRLLDVIPDAGLHVVGGTERSSWTSLGEAGRHLAELARAGRVTSVGDMRFGPGLFQTFADGDVLVVPSRTEGTPRVLVEARAFGCPVIATAVGGVPTSIDDEVDGLLVPPEDPATLASAISRVAHDRDLRARLVAGGFARARASTVDAFARTIGDEAVALLHTPPHRKDER